MTTKLSVEDLEALIEELGQHTVEHVELRGTQKGAEAILAARANLATARANAAEKGHA
jgi:hypothetical protein